VTSASLPRVERGGRRIQQSQRTGHAIPGTRELNLSFILVFLLLVGCGKSNVGTVQGTVMVDGSPAKEGSIAFFPVDGKSPTAGAEIRDGRYSAQVPLGSSRIEIRVPKVVGQKRLYNTPNSPIMPLLEESLPAKYNEQTELEFNVQPGENQRDYQLTTQ
jgi:hypothetical protein